MVLRILLLLAVFLCTCGPAHSQDRPNVLFIVVDDLRPEFGAYGATHIISPHLDSLAAHGLRFDRAYANVPVCGASRASILSGVRPTYHRFRRYYSQVDVEVPGLITLPEQFRAGGYTTVGVGKVFHEPWDRAAAAWTDGGPYVYGSDRMPYPEGSYGGWMNYMDPASHDTLVRARERSGKSYQGALPYEIVDTTDEAYFDGQYAHLATERLQEFAESEEPFFLAVGFVKPHLPFTAPKKYWDLYDRADIELPDNMQLPEDAPPALQKFNWGELRNYHGIPRKDPVSDSMARTLLHGYYASVSFVDAQIGKVLAELRRTGLDQNTLVVLWGDHGYNLGEHGFWAKHINMETAMRTTLLMAGPREAWGRGPTVKTGTVEEVVELVDLYPTLLDYCGLPKPQHKLAGESLVPLLQGRSIKTGDYALSKYDDGITLIGPRYRYTEYHEADGTLTARMLYDHEQDPDENRNLANLPEQAALVEELHQELHRQLPEEYWTVEPVAYPGRD